MASKAIRATLEPLRLEQAIESDRAAKKSYDKLRANGLRDTSLLLEFIGMAVAVAAERKPAKWYSDSGKTPKTLAYFPVRLKAMAEEIERLMAHPPFTPPPEFAGLPALLLNYAEHIDNRCRLIRQSRKGRPRTMGEVLRALRWLLLRETGKERPADLARLLAAAANGAGAPEFDFEAALKMNAHRYPIRSV